MAAGSPGRYCVSETFVIFLQLSIVALCWLAEHYFPRLSNRGDSVRRVFSILVVWAAALGAVAFCQAYLFQPLISLVAPFKIFSFSQLPIPSEVGFILSLLLLDLFQYLIHWASHKISPLWALHSVHHADKHVTAATGLLHHPLEMMLNFIVTVCLLILFGISLQVIVTYSLLSMFHNLLVHANVNIPARLDRVLRWFIVTPDMHRTHHSMRPTEGNSNFGQLFPYWDWLFRTYQAKPTTPLAKLKMGLIEPNKGVAFNPLELMVQPFRLYGAANRRKTK